MKKFFFVSALIAAVLCSCSDLVVEPDPENNPVNNFEIFWKEFDRYYSFFIYKNIDWTEQYHRYRPQITEQTSDSELFSVLSDMAGILRDGHVSILTPYGNYSYSGWRDNYPENYDRDIILSGYLRYGYTTREYGYIVYGKLTDSLGYLHVMSFSGTEKWYSIIDGIMEEMKDYRGLVLDVRNNGGGSTNLSTHLASRFADKERVYAYYQWRNGPDHDDFSGLEELVIEPSENWRYTQPVALLTNRTCFSSAEDFILSMRVFPHVTVIGDFTGGGSGNPIMRELPNGWVYRLSRWIERTEEKEMYEGIGLHPDILVTISEDDSAAGRDTILETAVQILNNAIENRP